MAAISKGRNVGAWILGGLLAFVYLLAGMPKLGLGPEDMVAEVSENFVRFGHSESFRMFIGAVEVAGAVGLLIPRLASLAAVGLVIIMSGAVYTHLSLGEEFVPPLVLLGLLLVVAALRRPQLLSGRASAPAKGAAAAGKARRAA